MPDNTPIKFTLYPDGKEPGDAFATGQRMTARALSMAADGKTPVKTILEMVKEKKLATGLVTTSGITDATPAAFATHVAHRSNEESVADQELKFGVDVLMGGRKQFFLPEVSAGKRKDGRNLLDEARAAGYAVVGDAEELKAAQKEPEKYRSLRVRMGGWCAYFTMLSKEQQDHHIRRQ